MKRWSNKGEIENPKIDLFLKEILEVCDRHCLGISHEDSHGSFEIVSMSDTERQWIMNATDRTTEEMSSTP